MRRPHEDGPTCIASFLGLILHPVETTAILFAEERPPFVFTYLIVGLMSVFAPLIYEIGRYRYVPPALGGLGDIALVVALTVGIFIVIEGGLLAILGLGFAPAKLLACIVYSSAPLVFALWLTFIFNYLGEGRLTIATLALTGARTPDDPMLRSLPFVVVIAQILMAIVFFFSLRRMLKLGTFDGGLIAAISFVPLYGAFIAALFIADTLRPGVVLAVLKLLDAPKGLW
jgi:hypothetical protein